MPSWVRPSGARPIVPIVPIVPRASFPPAFVAASSSASLSRVVALFGTPLARPLPALVRFSGRPCILPLFCWPALMDQANYSTRFMPRPPIAGAVQP